MTKKTSREYGVGSKEKKNKEKRIKTPRAQDRRQKVEY